jgi:hypothetical protein
MTDPIPETLEAVGAAGVGAALEAVRQDRRSIGTTGSPPPTHHRRLALLGQLCFKCVIVALLHDVCSACRSPLSMWPRSHLDAGAISRPATPAPAPPAPSAPSAGGFSCASSRSGAARDGRECSYRQLKSGGEKNEGAISARSRHREEALPSPLEAAHGSTRRGGLARSASASRGLSIIESMKLRNSARSGGVACSQLCPSLARRNQLIGHRGQASVGHFALERGGRQM